MKENGNESMHGIMKKGLLIINTGNGKGKTTAALGMAMRAAGHGMKVCFIQFIKGSSRYGELEAVKKIPDSIDLYTMGRQATRKSDTPKKNKEVARIGWEFARKVITSNYYQMVVLDEFTYLPIYEMIDMNSVLTILANRPVNLHVVITGRKAPEKLIEIADLVTDMQAVKHPLKNGITAQKGVEF
ncbi:MAG: cob(I)yrinic acid a,c-diamide adenosyltransferase [Desulfobacteraceae bacterium]